MRKRNSGHKYTKIVLPPGMKRKDVAWSPRQLNQLLSIAKGGFSSQRLIRIMGEFAAGYKFVHRYEKAVSIFGSARCGFKQQVYQEAADLAGSLAKDGYAVITGGGPGIMEAANRGAAEAGGHSVGLNIQLPTEQRANTYVKESSSYHYFFTRKVMLASASQVYVFFPGGFGTLDELFEMLTLVQTKKVSPVAIILVDSRFWKPLLSWIENIIYKKHYAISEQDTKLYRVVNSARSALRVIRKLDREGKLKRGRSKKDTLEGPGEGIIMPGACPIPESLFKRMNSRKK